MEAKGSKLNYKLEQNSKKNHYSIVLIYIVFYYFKNPKSISTLHPKRDFRIIGNVKIHVSFSLSYFRKKNLVRYIYNTSRISLSMPSLTDDNLFSNIMEICILLSLLIFHFP